MKASVWILGHFGIWGAVSIGTLIFFSFPFLCFSKPLFKAVATALAIAGFLVGGPSCSTIISSSPSPWVGCGLFLFTISHIYLSEDEETSSARCSALSAMVVSL